MQYLQKFKTLSTTDSEPLQLTESYEVFCSRQLCPSSTKLPGIDPNQLPGEDIKFRQSIRICMNLTTIVFMVMLSFQ